MFIMTACEIAEKLNTITDDKQQSINIYKLLRSNSLNMHSFMLMRDGVIIEEYYSLHSGENEKHPIFSIEKSLISLAVGKAIEADLLSLDNYAIDFYPGDLSDLSIHPYIARTTIRDMLMMHGPYVYGFPSQREYIWDTFLNSTQDKREPGTQFVYDTLNSNILESIILCLTGSTILEYLQPIFSEIGVTVESSTGQYSPWIMTTHDLAKLTQFIMDMGEHNGNQLIDRKFMIAATSFQGLICSRYYDSGSFGYGYKFWILENNGVAMFGMHGQFAIFHKPTKTVFVALMDQHTEDEELKRIIYNAFFQIANIALI